MISFSTCRARCRLVSSHYRGIVPEGRVWPKHTTLLRIVPMSSVFRRLKR
jgi:hypothetical protein